MEKVWLQHYPKNVPPEIDAGVYNSIPQMLEETCRKYRDLSAFICMGSELTYEDLNYYSADFAAFLQNEAGLVQGDRVAVQMPNILQYPVVLFGILRAGMIAVNVNPLYSAREMKHQLVDSGAKAIVMANTAAHKLEDIIGDTNLETVVVTGIGDLLGWPKSMAVNAATRYIKKMVPAYNLPFAYSFYEAMDLGSETAFVPPELTPEDIAFLQYTGGTTGRAKGAVLTHKNILANILQISAWMKPRLVETKEMAVNALPLYHIFSLTLNCFALMYYGATNVLITNPRDMNSFVKTLKKTKFTIFPGLNTLFNGLMNHPEFGNIDFSHLKIAVAGGMALQKDVAKKWKERTKTPIVEGYGLTETSPVLCCNPLDGTDKIGTIGLPVPSTDIRLIDENDETTEVAPGEEGELCAKGPQVMTAYWKQPQETASVFTKDGWLKTGDVARVDQEGFFQIVDRKKDMIVVSGFNVYPNEVEDVIAANEKVVEVAAVGIPDDKSGEVVKVFVVPKDETLTQEELVAFCREQLAGYKVPKEIEFRSELPKTNVGKILRRGLRDEHKASSPQQQLEQ